MPLPLVAFIPRKRRGRFLLRAAELVVLSTRRRPRRWLRSPSHSVDGERHASLDWCLEWSADRLRSPGAGAAQSRLRVVRRDGGGLRRLTQGRQVVTMWSWNGDGLLHVAYAAEPLEGGELLMLRRNPVDAVMPKVGRERAEGAAVPDLQLRQGPRPHTELAPATPGERTPMRQCCTRLARAATDFSISAPRSGDRRRTSWPRLERKDNIGEVPRPGSEETAAVRVRSDGRAPARRSDPTGPCGRRRTPAAAPRPTIRTAPHWHCSILQRYEPRRRRPA